MVGDYRLLGMDDGHRAGQREPFIALQVQDRCKAARQYSATVGLCERALQNNGSLGDAGAGSAPGEDHEQGDGEYPSSLTISSLFPFDPNMGPVFPEDD